MSKHAFPKFGYTMMSMPVVQNEDYGSTVMCAIVQHHSQIAVSSQASAAWYDQGRLFFADFSEHSDVANLFRLIMTPHGASDRLEIRLLGTAPLEAVKHEFMRRCPDGLFTVYPIRTVFEVANRVGCMPKEDGNV